MKEYRDEIFDDLFTGCTKAISKIKKDLKKKRVYGFVIAPDSGYTGFGIAIGVRGQDDVANNSEFKHYKELFAEFPELEMEWQDELDQQSGVEASEWKRFAKYGDCFRKLNSNLRDMIDGFYDDGHEPESVSEFFENVCIAVLRKLKKDKAFSDPVFEKSLLTGIQFHDPTAAATVIRASDKLNIRKWHAQILEVFSAHAEEQAREQKARRKKLKKKKTAKKKR